MASSTGLACAALAMRGSTSTAAMQRGLENRLVVNGKTLERCIESSTATICDELAVRYNVK